MMGGIGFPLMGLGSLLVVGLVIAGIAWLIQASQHRTGPVVYQAPRGGDTPLEILKRRYAAGEVTKEEFDSMKRDLE